MRKLIGSMAMVAILVSLAVIGCGDDEEESAPLAQPTTEQDSPAPVECKGEGESIPLIPDPPGCCEGLAMISPTSPDVIGISGICTAKCGDGVCDSESETNYNCLEDCKEDPASMPTVTDEEPTPTGGITWDLPLLFGCKELTVVSPQGLPEVEGLTEAFWTIPAAPKEWSEPEILSETLYYECDTPPHVVATFYGTQQLPKEGADWIEEEGSWRETIEERSGFWTKNQGSDGLRVWIKWDDGKGYTYSALTRYVK